MNTLNRRKTGKYTEDPIKNLPNLPERRVKPLWADPNTKIDLQVNSRDNPEGKDSFDIIRELSSRMIKIGLFKLFYCFLNL